MKRKSGRKSQKNEEENSNGVEDQAEQSDETGDVDEDQPPKDKKRKPSKTGTKNKDGPASTEPENSEHSNDEGEVKEKKRHGRKSKKSTKTSTDNDEEAPLKYDENEQESKKTNKKAKKSPKSADENQDEDDETQYEVESVLDEKVIGGVRHYLIRWKGYEEESDTWEPESTLDCQELIDKFKKRKKKESKREKSLKKNKKGGKASDWAEDEDFEVDRILEVHHKRDGKREFLVSWKGYSQEENSWEPEENMDCKDLIEKFMAKVQKAKDLDEKELRVNRKQVQRFTLSMQERSRRLSKRFSGKERVHYHDAE